MNNREIEKKFIVSENIYNDLYSQFEALDLFPIVGVSRDIFYNAPNSDVCRYRENTEEFTIKVNDKSTIIDRIEENTKIDTNSKESFLRSLSILFGPPSLILTKTFNIFTFGECVVSLYTVREDKKNRFFLEVESSSLENVNEFIETLTFPIGESLPELQTKSLYKLFLEEKNEET